MKQTVKKIARLNMSTRKYIEDNIPPAYRGLGGRALTSNIVSGEVSPKADPLGKENKLIFAAGLFAGTAVPNSGRLSVGAKSPLTNTIKEANAGGAAAQKLAQLGLQAVVVEGKAEEPQVVKIDKSGATFFPASRFDCMGNYQLIQELRKEFGDTVAFVTIGPAGEDRLHTASVAVTSPDFHIRMAARGGLGAVMGAKGLKAVVIDDAATREGKVHDQAELKKAVSELSKVISGHPLSQGLRQLGTPLLVMMMNSAGCLPTKNYSIGQFDGAEQISGERAAALMNERPNGQPVHRCMNGCIINCSNIYTDKKGNVLVSGLEYETLGMVGSNCMIADLDMIARINRLCNDIGVDTMEIGAALAVAMEGGLLPWGNGEAALALLGEITKRTDRGIMIASGCRFTGEKLGVKRIPQVKGQSLAAYDPRLLKGTGTTYATCTMGADHTCGNALPSPANPGYNPASPTGQAAVSGFLQSYFAAVDSLGLCLFASLPLLEVPDAQKHLTAAAAAVTGEAPAESYLLDLGKSVLKVERGFNNRAGFGRADDRLPPFFSIEPLPPSGLIFDVAEEELDSLQEG